MKHNYQGVATGNPFQPQGRHRPFMLDQGVGLIPLGDRHRADTDFHAYYFTGVLEERDSTGSYEKFLKKKGK